MPSVGLVAGGYYLYENKDRLIDEVKVQITEAAIDGVSEPLPGLMGGSAEVPEARSAHNLATPSLSVINNRSELNSSLHPLNRDL